MSRALMTTTLAWLAAVAACGGTVTGSNGSASTRGPSGSGTPGGSSSTSSGVGACNGGCLCYSTPATCPTGCNPAYDGSGTFFCGNGLPPVVGASTPPAGMVDAAFDAGATARAYVAASLRSGGSGTCNFGSTTSILVIGSQDPTRPLTDTNPLRVDDGSDAGGAVSIACTVHPAGGIFEVQLSATHQNQLAGGGGAMMIVGTVDPTTGGTGLNGTFANGGVQYDDVHCSLQFTDNGQPITLANNAPKVAAGRIWAHVDCPQATSVASGQNFVCDAQADFVFENCGM